MSLTTCGNCDDDEEKEEEEKKKDGWRKEQGDAGLDADAALLHGEGDDGITVRARTFNFTFQFWEGGI